MKIRDTSEPTMSREEMADDYIRLKREYTLLHEDYRRLKSKNEKRMFAIKFADALLNDFEISEFENGELCGAPQKLKTNEVYDRYIDEILSNDC